MIRTLDKLQTLEKYFILIYFTPVIFFFIYFLIPAKKKNTKTWDKKF